MATVDRSLPSRLLRPFAGEAISPPPPQLFRYEIAEQMIRAINVGDVRRSIVVF